MFAKVMVIISERLRDIWLWPLNLMRYFPTRLRRLGQLFTRALPITTDIYHDPASHPGRGAIALRWSHALLCTLFDLVGGPELLQWVMRWLLMVETTPLTAAEEEAAVSVLGVTALPYGAVRVAQGGLLKWAFKINRNRAFATWHTIFVPRRQRRPRAELSLMVHELTHIYQYEQVGSRYIGEAVWVQGQQGAACYQYGGAPGLTAACGAGKQLANYNWEQQAQIAQDYYILQQQGRDTAAYDPLIAQIRAGHL